MRISLVIFIILTIMAITWSQERPKKDISYFKKIIEIWCNDKSRSANDYKLYETLGANNNIRKDIPGLIIKPTLVSNEQLSAPQRVKSLFHLEILNRRKNDKVKRIPNLLMPERQKPINEEEKIIDLLKLPTKTTIKQPEQIKHTEVFESVPLIKLRPAEIEAPIVPIKPSHIKTYEIYEPTYSYTQKGQDGSTTTYKSQGNRHTIVTEIELVPILPLYMKLRMKESAAKCVTGIHCYTPISDSSFQFLTHLKISISSTEMPLSTNTMSETIFPVASHKVNKIISPNNIHQHLSISDDEDSNSQKTINEPDLDNFSHNNPIVVADYVPDAYKQFQSNNTNETSNQASLTTVGIAQNSSVEATTEKSINILKVIFR